MEKSQSQSSTKCRHLTQYFLLLLSHVQKTERHVPAIQRVRARGFSDVWCDDSVDHFVFYLFSALLKKEELRFLLCNELSSKTV